MFKHRKPKKLLSLFLVMTLFCAVLPGVSLADEPIDSGSITTVPSMYDPTLVFPGYASATTYREKVAASQLPESSLDSVSTEYLVQAILSTPAIYGIFSCNDRDYGAALDRITPFYNTLVELNKRSDSGKVLLAAYEELDFEAISGDSGEFNFLSYFSPILLEVLIGANVHFNRLTATEKQTLLETAREIAEKKVTYGICGKGYKNVFFESLGDEAFAYYDITAVLDVSVDGDGYIPTTVYTYDGHSVTAKKWAHIDMYEMADTEKKRQHDLTIASHPYVTLISEATYKYNCHSYAWHRPETTNDIWISDASPYVSDTTSIRYNENELLTNISNIDIIVYCDSSGNILHSAEVVGVSSGQLIVISKWGANGLYRHEYRDTGSEYLPSDGAIYGYSYEIHKYQTLRWGYREADNTYHYKVCQLCGGSMNMSVYQTHSWYYKTSIHARHERRCDGCDTTIITMHTYQPVDSISCKIDCVCGYYEVNDHNFEWTTTETTHAGECIRCGYSTSSTSHSFGLWTSSGAVYHGRTCEICGYYTEEAHTPNSSYTECTACGYTGPFSTIMSNRPGYEPTFYENAVN